MQATTKEVEKFYNASLKKSHNQYEFDRWHKSGQKRSSFVSTKSALHRHALPLVKEGNSVLEIGPGPGTWTKEFLQKYSDVSFTVVDISEQMLAQASENLSNDARVHMVHSDVLEYEPTQEFDFFFSSRFLEYVPEKDRVVALIQKSLKSGGKGYLVTKTPQYNRVFSKTNPAAVHQGQISAKELSALFEANGLTVTKVVTVTAVFPGLRSGFMDRVLTRICGLLPFSIARHVGESYALVFEKK